MGACSNEATTPLDFGPSSSLPSGTSPASPEDDPNAEARSQIQQLAEAECLRDPSRAEGVVEMADAETGAVVSVYRISCETLEPITGEPAEAPATSG